ncbi:MAG: hypothetical protein LGR52_04675 [Candidatus Thiosymbion ectosymbiont of Robbea hypermnestra]|nr:hypothetical protein [Candidatus Thiosymbion ectosymbiont of Robbea hypermnestra]
MRLLAAFSASAQPSVRGWIFLLTSCLLIAWLGPAQASSWTGTLQDGSVLKVDPDSHRAMRYYKGGVTPLWDGAHRLEDGSVVIVRDGQAVPTASMLHHWEGEPGSEPSLRMRFCDRLVRKVCGFRDECSQSQACILARQLLGMEREQQRRAPIGAGSRPRTASGDECRAALSNPTFPVCSSATPGSEQTACKQLVDKVCGDADQCATGKACNPARQLLRMESEERLESADPDALTPTGAECEKAMDNAFFAPCG